MAKGARAAGAPLLSGLPDEIVIWEILIRLPSKSLLRCQAVCCAWRRATQAHDFLLAHHARQLTLPILYYYNFKNDSLDILCFDHRATDQLQPVAQFSEISSSSVCASRDGLLILAKYGTTDRCFSICNPATREYALLPQLSRFFLLGMYPHSPTNEYRILVLPDKDENPDRPSAVRHDTCYIFTLGSTQPLRNIGCLQKLEKLRFSGLATLLRGSLHWSISNMMIMVFNTTAESFHQMCSPTAGTALFEMDGTTLFEMDGMLGMASFTTLATTNIWVLQDYENEVWTLKCRIELPVAEFSLHCEQHGHLHRVRVVPGDDGELLVLANFGEWLFQVNMDGKLVASFHRKRVYPTQFQHKQTLARHAFFPMLEGYVVNDFPFM